MLTLQKAFVHMYIVLYHACRYFECTLVLQKLPKQAFLCASSYDEPFSLLCANATHPATGGASYYTICGTSFPNIAEYKCIIIAACTLGAVVYYQLLFRSGMKAQKQKKN